MATGSMSKDAMKMQPVAMLNSSTVSVLSLFIVVFGGVKAAGVAVRIGDEALLCRASVHVIFCAVNKVLACCTAGGFFPVVFGHCCSFLKYTSLPMP